MPLGQKWQSNFDAYLHNTSSTVKTLYRPNGTTITFTSVGGVWTPPVWAKQLSLTLVSGQWKFTDFDDTVETYDSSYRLISIATRDGYVQSLSYDAQNFVTNVVDTYGRTLTFTYTTYNARLGGAYRGKRLASITTPGGLQIKYYYDGSMYWAQNLPDRLIRVSELDAGSGAVELTRYVYHFENWKFPGFITGISDGRGVRFATFEYNDDARAISSKHTNNADETTVAYDSDLVRTVTNALGQAEVYTYQTIAGVKVVSSIARQASATVPAATKTYTYDTNGQMLSRTDFDGTVTTYTRDTRGLQASRIEADGLPEERTIATTWHSTLKVPTQIVRPGVTVDLVWDSSKRLTSRTETDTTGGTSNGQTRTWTFTWTTTGLLESVNGPRTDLSDVTSYAYNASGYLTTVTNALSQVTEVTAHNGRGLPLSVEDPNGIVTTLTYDSEGRLTSSTVDGKKTSFQYDRVGQLVLLTEANGNETRYEYDNARRLTAIENSRGERVEFTPDDLGNQTALAVKSGEGAILRSQAQVFDTLGRLLQSIGADSQTTAYEYDASGNAVEITDPRSAVTSQAFDGLNRLVTVTDALSGVTEMAYDAAGNLTEVTDPDGRVTTYAYNGFGEVLTQTSPDTGVTSYVRDAAGNIVTKTDARGVVTEFTYDALNRVLTKTFPASSAENVSFGYDSQAGGNHGVGRLTSVTDESGGTAYIYDARGNITSESLTIGSANYQTAYTYDAADNLTQVTYPTGQIVTYDRDERGLVRAIYSQSGPTAPPVGLVSNIDYLPFGPVKSLTYGNRTKITYAYDADYRLTDIVANNGAATLQDLTFTYDDGDNIVAITDAVEAGRSQVLGYDSLNRLTSASGAYGTEDYTYDGVANRATRQLDVGGITTNVTYAYAAGTNRLQSASNGTDTRSFTYDDVGNVVAEALNATTNFSYVYNANNRMAEATANGTPVSYKYNAFGERVIRAVSGGATTHSFFDRNGALIAEMDDLGAPLKSYLYLDGLPIAQIQPGGSVPDEDTGLDDSDTGTSSTGIWSASTDGTGFEGTGHQVAAPIDPATAGGTIVDNTDPGFSTFGQWNAGTATGTQGADYLRRDKQQPLPSPVTVDNSDAAPAFAMTGTWTQDSVNNAINGNVRYKAISPSAHGAILDNANSSVYSTTGSWTTSTAGTKYGANYQWHMATTATTAITVDDGDAGYSQPSGYGWSTASDSNAHGGDFRWLDLSPNAIIADNSDPTRFSATGTWNVSTAGTASEKQGPNFLWHYNNYLTTQTVIYDNDDPKVTVTGTWSPSTAVGYFYGPDYLTHAAATSTTDEIIWPLDVTSTGQYRLFMRWVSSPSRPTNATFTVTHDSGTTNFVINQRSESQRGLWLDHGVFDLTQGAGQNVKLTGVSNGSLTADAIAFHPVNAPRDTATWTVPVATTGQYNVWARWRASSDRATNATYVISHAGGNTSVSMDQRETSGSWRFLGSYNFNAGSAVIELNDTADGIVIADAVALDPVPVTPSVVQWTPTLPSAGQYKVYAKWTPGANRTSAAQYTVTHDGGQTNVTVDQRETPSPWYSGGRGWNYLGTFDMTPGQGHKVELLGAGNGAVIADAVSFEPVNAQPNKAVWRPSLTVEDEYNVWAMWRANTDMATNSPYTIYHAGGTTTVTKNQQSQGGQWVSLGTYSFAPGQDHRVELTDRLPDGSFVNGLLSADALVFESTTSPGNPATWTPTLAQSDRYEVLAWWPYISGAATNAKYFITHAGGGSTATQNHAKPNQGWLSLGEYDLTKGAGHKVELSDNSDGRVIADAVQFRPVQDAERYASWQGTVSSSGDYHVFVRWPEASDLAPNARYKLTLPSGVSTVVKDQSRNGGAWQLLKTVNLAANDNWKIDLSDQAAGPVAADAVAVVPVGSLPGFTWAPTLPVAGDYQVFAKWPELSGLAKDAAFEVTHEDGTDSVKVSQAQGGGAWRFLGTWNFDPANSPSVTLRAALSGAVSADAVRFVKPSASGGMSYILSDQVAQPQKMVSQAGTVTWDRVATPFGETASMATGGSADLSVRFPGQQDDLATGLAYNYFRDYDASLGRYMQSDPIGIQGGLSTYAYTGANPVTYVDPTGENPVVALFFAGAAIYGGYAFLDEMMENCWSLDRVNWWRVGMELSQGGTEGLLTAVGGPLVSKALGKISGVARSAAGRFLGGGGGKAVGGSNSAIGNSASNISSKIHPGKQGKHVPGHNDFIPNRSPLNQGVDPQKLLNAFHSGEAKVIGSSSRGQPVVDFGRTIGVDSASGLATRYGTVHSGKGGAHIVPANPTKYGGTP